MTPMGYGAAYAPATHERENRISMLSMTENLRHSHYRAYRPVRQRNASSHSSIPQIYTKSTRSSEDSTSDLYAASSEINTQISEDPRAALHDAPRPARYSTAASPISPRSPSWNLSAMHLQESLPQQPKTLNAPPVPTSEPTSPEMRPSIFGTRDLLQEPYQESVAWANSTQFNIATSQDPYSFNDEALPKQQRERGPSVFTLQSQSREGGMRKDSDARQYFRHPRRILEPWSPGIWKRFPVWGFGALFMVLLLTGASAAMLLASNGKTTDDWKVGRGSTQPHIYISVFEMVMNFLVLFALVDGMVVRYWRQMLHGSTLSSLHDTFESVRLWPAVKRVTTLRFNKVAVACVFATVSFLRGPLFQVSLTLSPSPSPQTTLTYSTNPIPLTLAIFLSFLSVLSIIPLYFGFWELGRSVSLNPLETAKAFGAPLLKGLDGNATPEMISFERGGMNVKYGALERFGEGKDLRVEETSRATVRMPWEGEIFS